MSCFNPTIAWYSNTFGKTGKRQLVFNRTAAHFPTKILLPCGKCIGCLQQKARTWMIRCNHENKLHKESCFITLTYDPEKIPPGHTLVKRDLQLFMKRLRKKLEPQKVRHYAIGDYGEKTNRPHYHILLFGWTAPIGDRTLFKKSKHGADLYHSATLAAAWPLGHSSLGSVSVRSINYCTSYLVNTLGPQREYDVTLADGEVIRRQKPFALMSKKPGIGSGYVDIYHDELIAHDTVVINHHEVNFPRYYDTQLIKKEYMTPEQLEHTKHYRRLEKRPPHSENLIDRLRVREKHEQLKLNAFKKGAL